MIQLLAATVFTLMMGYIFHMFALGMKKPYDGMDIGIGFVLIVGVLIGLSRILWLAFRS